jgi:large subunit ribosomal protein L33
MGDRVVITLGCTDCKNKNYTYQHGKKKDFKLEIKKFCRCCRKQTQHKEVKG